MIVSNFKQYQPRFRAWLRFLGAKDGDDVKLYEYMAWAPRKVAEYKRINGLATNFPLTNEQNRKCDEWLLEQAP